MQEKNFFLLNNSLELSSMLIKTSNRGGKRTSKQIKEWYWTICRISN